MPLKQEEEKYGELLLYMVFTNVPYKQMCFFFLNVSRSGFPASSRRGGDCLLAQHGPDLP